VNDCVGGADAGAGAGAAMTPKRKRAAAVKEVGHRLGGSPTAVGVGGVVPVAAAAAAAASPSPVAVKKPKKTGTFKGKKNTLGSSGVGVGVGVEALDARVRRRTGDLAAREAISTAAMLRDPDGGEGEGGGAANAAATAMAADLMRAAEAGSLSASDPTIGSLQRAMRAVVSERRAEAEGNAKVSAALTGGATFQTMPDGRLLVRYAATDAGGRRREMSEIIQDLPAAFLPVVLRVVAADESAEARANLAPAAMAVASPRVFWAIVRHAGVGGGDGGRSFEDACERIAPGAADWATAGLRGRKRPERYSEYVSH
jgi:hypothetical protein